MSNLLQEIIDETVSAVSVRRMQLPLNALSDRGEFSRATISLREAIVDAQRPAVIAEFKRRSPSRGVFVGGADISAVVSGYEQAGAVGISILTNETFFGGSLEDLAYARTLVACPLLRKDFVLDSYQLHEAKAFGADAVLLIARCLSANHLKDLIAEARVLKLDTLLEVHDMADIEKSRDLSPSLWGVNNRDLDTLQIDLCTTEQLVRQLPLGAFVISESGLKTAQDLFQAKKWGAQGYLIGDHFLSSTDPVTELRNLIGDTEQLVSSENSI
jgi:indole-3-glycerol phosphate synthase